MGMRRLPIVLALAAVLGIAAGGVRGAAGMRPRLAALAFTGSSGVVLLSDGQIVSFDAGTGAVGRRLFQVPLSHQALEAVAWDNGGTWMLCLPVYARAGDTRASWLLQQAAGRQIWTWLPSRGLYVGVGVDPARGVGYVANATTYEVFAIALDRRDAAPRYVASIRGASQLGAAAFDPVGRELFVSDADLPRVYGLAVDTGVVREAASFKGAELRALAIDASGRRLLLADAAQEAVWALSLAPAGRVSRFSAIPQFHDPTGIAVGPAGRVWVADAGAASVFRLSADGAAADITTRW